MREPVQLILNTKGFNLNSLTQDSYDFLIESAQNYYNYLVENNLGYNEIKIQSISKTIFGLQLTLKSELFSLEGLVLRFLDEEFPISENLSIQTSFYDEKHKILSLEIEESLKNQLFEKKNEIGLFSDLKFLIKNILNFYLSLKPLHFPTTLPRISPDIQALKDLKNPPHQEQLEALEGIFSKSFCYVWGVAGSGKTKMVLLHALAFYLKSNLKVAILAPTNNALEQSLNTLIESLNNIGIDTSCILRLGTPTQTFAQRFPQNCDPLLNNKPNYKKAIQKSLLIAATLDTFLRRDELYELLFAHFFIDEAAFCPLIKVIPLCMFNKPITLLGDHKQLQPICLLNKQDSNNPKWQISKFWQYSSLFLESFFRHQTNFFKANPTTQINSPNYPFYTLTYTHRYGDNLAKLLDFYIYKNNLKGLPNHTNLFCHFIQTTSQENNANLDEANACCYLAKRFLQAKKNFAILTPFVNQRKLILQKMPALRNEECVFTIHSSQGQEFDCVIFSPVTLNYYLNDSRNPQALFALNVALSRAKKEIIIVCDKNYWLNQKGQFLNALIQISKPFSLSQS